MMKRREKGTPPSGNPAARGRRDGSASAFDGVGALAVFALGGNDGQAHLLADGPRQEPANAVRLPASGLHQFLSRNAAVPLQQVQDLRGLAAVAGAFGLFRGFGRFGRFLGGGAFLPGFAFLGATFARCAPARAFLPGFSLAVWVAAVSSLIMLVSPWR